MFVLLGAAARHRREAVRQRTREQGPRGRRAGTQHAEADPAGGQSRHPQAPTAAAQRGVEHLGGTRRPGTGRCAGSSLRTFPACPAAHTRLPQLGGTSSAQPSHAEVQQAASSRHARPSLGRMFCCRIAAAPVSGRSDPSHANAPLRAMVSPGSRVKPGTSGSHSVLGVPAWNGTPAPAAISEGGRLVMESDRGWNRSSPAGAARGGGAGLLGMARALRRSTTGALMVARGPAQLTLPLPQRHAQVGVLRAGPLAACRLAAEIERAAHAACGIHVGLGAQPAAVLRRQHTILQAHNVAMVQDALAHLAALQSGVAGREEHAWLEGHTLHALADASCSSARTAHQHTAPAPACLVCQAGGVVCARGQDFSVAGHVELRLISK